MGGYYILQNNDYVNCGTAVKGYNVTIKPYNNEK